jgi:catechol 2,3-dioxygenase-like lactoylglutathione lyase family enzyme
MPDRFSSITTRCLSLCLVLLPVTTAIYGLRAANDPPRPLILGIAGVRFYSTDLDASRNFYAQILQSSEVSRNAFSLNSQQIVALFDAPSPAPSSLLAEVVFETDDLAKLQRYLTNKKVQVTPKLVSGIQHWDMVGLGYSTLATIDPEGHRISFVKRTKPVPPSAGSVATRPPSAQRIIHAGFVVHDRAAEDKFYKDILGFHVYWHGGMKEGEDNWVDMQVPDGTDWIEYMLKVPDNATHKQLGVMNHIALGVPDIHAAHQQLIKNGWKGTEEPKIGRDGKWQLNLYDPDETRVEMMEFKPTKEPCCSPYTGPHPGP